MAAESRKEWALWNRVYKNLINTTLLKTLLCKLEGKALETFVNNLTNVLREAIPNEKKLSTDQGDIKSPGLKNHAPWQRWGELYSLVGAKIYLNALLEGLSSEGVEQQEIKLTESFQAVITQDPDVGSKAPTMTATASGSGRRSPDPAGLGDNPSRPLSGEENPPNLVALQENPKRTMSPDCTTSRAKQAVAGQTVSDKRNSAAHVSDSKLSTHVPPQRPSQSDTPASQTLIQGEECPGSLTKEDLKRIAFGRFTERELRNRHWKLSHHELDRLHGLASGLNTDVLKWLLRAAAEASEKKEYILQALKPLLPGYMQRTHYIARKSRLPRGFVKLCDAGVPLVDLEDLALLQDTVVLQEAIEKRFHIREVLDNPSWKPSGVDVESYFNWVINLSSSQREEEMQIALNLCVEPGEPDSWHQKEAFLLIWPTLEKYHRHAREALLQIIDSRPRSDPATDASENDIFTKTLKTGEKTKVEAKYKGENVIGAPSLEASTPTHVPEPKPGCDEATSRSPGNSRGKAAGGAPEAGVTKAYDKFQGDPGCPARMGAEQTTEELPTEGSSKPSTVPVGNSMAGDDSEGESVDKTGNNSLRFRVSQDDVAASGKSVVTQVSSVSKPKVLKKSSKPRKLTDNEVQEFRQQTESATCHIADIIKALEILDTSDTNYSGWRKAELFDEWKTMNGRVANLPPGFRELCGAHIPLAELEDLAKYTTVCYAFGKSRDGDWGPNEQSVTDCYDLISKLDDIGLGEELEWVGEVFEADFEDSDRIDKKAMLAALKPLLMETLDALCKVARQTAKSAHDRSRGDVAK